MGNSTRRRRARSVLISAMIVAAIMFVGFARNYYLRNWLGTHVLSLTAHVHGLIMTCWVLLFLAQALLVSAHRVDLHRRLGAAGAVLAALVVAFGLYTIHGDIERQYPGASPMIQAEGFVAFDGISLLIFGGLIVAALIARRQPEIHRRLMTVAMISLLPPAFGRLVAYFTHQHVEEIVLGLMTASVISAALIDALHRGRLHVVFLSGGAAVVAANVLTYIAQVI
jgi:hypothetical protein